MDIVFVIFVLLTISYLLCWVFKKLGLPKIPAYIAVGFIVGLPYFKDKLMTDSVLSLISSLSSLGIILLLYFIGLKVDLKKLLKVSGPSLHVAVWSAAVPLVLGFCLMKFLGFSNLVSFITGGILTVTSEAVSAAILEEHKLFNSKLGRTIIGAAIFDDVFEILLLAAVTTVISYNASGAVATGMYSAYGALNVFINLGIFVFLIYIIRYLYIPLILRLSNKEQTHTNLFSASFIIVLLMAVAANSLDLGTVVGALIAGIILRHLFFAERKIAQAKYVIDVTETFAFGFLAPIFFIWIGMNTDWTILLRNPVLAISITAVAIFGKFFGAVIANKITRQNAIVGRLVGWGMNARGEVDVIAAEMLRQANVLSVDVYSALIFMAFVSTALSPIMFKNGINEIKKSYATHLLY